MALNIAKQILIDHHAHVLRDDFDQVDAIGLRQAFSEARSIGMFEQHVPNTVSYMDFLRKIGAFLDIKGEAALLNLREQLGQTNYLNMLLDDASIGAFIIDDGYKPTNFMSLAKFSSLCERPVYRCRRIESAIEETLMNCQTFQQLRTQFKEALLETQGYPVVSLKTIAAYRGGLEIDQVSLEQAEEDFAITRGTAIKDGVCKISRSPLYHFLLSESFTIAQKEKIPVQVHCGTGDQDQDLRTANPLCMRSILEQARFRGTHFVFLHCYPFVREAAYLASIYPNVFMDISVIGFIASPAVPISFTEALAGAPTSKILASTDGHTAPETYWYGAHSTRTGLTIALQQLSDAGYLDTPEAESIAALILHGNAQRLYNLCD